MPIDIPLPTPTFTETPTLTPTPTLTETPTPTAALTETATHTPTATPMVIEATAEVAPVVEVTAEVTAFVPTAQATLSELSTPTPFGEGIEDTRPRFSTLSALPEVAYNAANVADLANYIRTADCTKHTIIVLQAITYTLTAPDPQPFTGTGFDGFNFNFGQVGLPVVKCMITIRGNGAIIERSSGATATFRIFGVDGYSQQGGVRATGALRLENVTLRNGRVTDRVGGGAIFSIDATLEIANNTIIANNSVQISAQQILGGGVYGFRSDVSIENSTFSNNTNTSTDGDGGALGLIGGTANVLHSSIFNNTTSRYGGAVYLDNSVTQGAIFLSNRILQNQAAVAGGGFYVYARGATFITSNEIRGNTGTANGSAFFAIFPQSNLFLQNNCILDHQPTSVVGNGLQATQNWWGNPLGPGGTVGTGVQVSPYLIGAPANCTNPQPAVADFSYSFGNQTNPAVVVGGVPAISFEDISTGDIAPETVAPRTWGLKLDGQVVDYNTYCQTAGLVLNCAFTLSGVYEVTRTVTSIYNTPVSKTQTITIRSVAAQAMDFHTRWREFGLPLPFNLWPIDRNVVNDRSQNGYGPNSFAYSSCEENTSDCQYNGTQGIHTGLDYFTAPQEAPVVAVCNGVIIQGRNSGGGSVLPTAEDGLSLRCFAVEPNDTDGDGNRNLSNIVVTNNHLNLDKGFSKNSNEIVNAGNVLATTTEYFTTTGSRISAHLHLEIFVGRGFRNNSTATRINPLFMYSDFFVQQHNQQMTYLGNFDKWSLEGNIISPNTNFWDNQNASVFIYDLDAYLLTNGYASDSAYVGPNCSNLPANETNFGQGTVYSHCTLINDDAD